MHGRHRVLAVITTTTLGALTLAGCGLVNAVSMSPNAGRTATAASVPARPGTAHTAVPVAAAASARPLTTAGTGTGTGTGTSAATGRRTPGDLDAGAVTHRLPAGAYHLVIDYWTSQSPATWTASTPAIVQLSAHMEGGPAGQAAATHRPAIQVTRFSATINDGSTLSTLASDIGQFVLTPPFSYGSALQLPGSKASATGALVTTQFDLLIETTPTSGAFYRQTVIDTLHLSFASKE